MMKGMLFLILIIFCVQSFATFGKKDVCIVGSGAAGMSAAVFLKDKGYSVFVIEKDDKVGGHCDTSYFTPPSPGQQNWIELGVTVFPDTTKDGQNGIGTTTLGSREFAQRFLAPNGTYPYGGYVPNYGFDFQRQFSTGLIPQSPPTPEYIDAFVRYNTILATKYPWVENANIPDPIPAELLRPFGDFITTNNLQPLNQFFQALLLFGGMGNYKNVTSLYAIQFLRRGVTTIYSDPSFGFAIKGGCQKIYEGITNYIQPSNIALNAKILLIKRLRNEEVKILYRVGNRGRVELLDCKNLIISFPQVKDHLDFLDLTLEEINVFKDVVPRYYYNFRVDANGPITVNSPYNLASIDIVNPDAIPLPNILDIRREIPYGPAVGYAYSETNIKEIQMFTLVNQYLGYIPSSLLTNINVTVFDQHFYQPYFTPAVLARSPSPYTRLKNLQGKKNTYWAGALYSFAETATVWQKTYDMINQYFPAK